MPNDSIEFRITIIKPYLEKSNTFIQDSIQDSIQDPIQDSIQDSIQLKDFVQSEHITMRRNPLRPRKRFIRFQNNIIDITVYMFKFMSSSANF